MSSIKLLLKNILYIFNLKDEQVLTTKDFDEIVKLAEKMYYERILFDTPVEGEA